MQANLDYTGDLDPAAEDLQTNTYDQEISDYPIHKELLENQEEDAVEMVADKSVNPQAEHFRAFREEVDRMKAERETEKREFQLQMDLLKANSIQRPPTPELRKERRFLEGMSDNDIPSVAELRQEWEVREAGYRAQLEELQVMQSHPDYGEVLEKYTANLVKSDRNFLSNLNNAENKALYAYTEGKKYQHIQELESKLKEYEAPQLNKNAQRIVENSRKPGTLSQAGGQNSLSKADYFATMSDAEFIKFASRNLEGI